MNLLMAIMLSNLFLLLIWVTYELWLSRSRNFQANRFFLLGGSILSVVLPWIPWKIHFVHATAGIFTLPMVTVIGGTTGQLPAPDAAMSIFQGDPAHIVLYIYLAIALTFMILSMAHLIQMRIWIRTRPIIKMEGHRIVVLDKRGSAFSFFRTVFFPAPFDPDDQRTITILKHEQVHARQLHSVDNLIMMILRALFCYNPAIYLIFRKLQLTHEFIADQTSSGMDKYSYSQALLDHQYSLHPILIGHSFNNPSFLTRRLIMLSKNTSKPVASWKYLLIAPLVAGMVMLCGWTASAQSQAQKKQESAVKQEVKATAVQPVAASDKQDKSTNATAKKAQIKFTKPVVKKDAEVKEPAVSYSTVDVKPEFPGGQEGLNKWIKETTKYPVEAIEKKITGKVFISFVISKTGEIKDAKVLRAVNPLLDAEALRVITTMPKWTPGSIAGKPVAVSFQIPINFAFN